MSADTIDWSYQRNGVNELPSWVPCELLPLEVESLILEMTAVTRGPGRETANLADLFIDEERDLRQALRYARGTTLLMEVPF